MKALFFLISAFLVVFFLGCQENSITDPGTIEDNNITAPSAQQLTSKNLLSSYPKSIEIDKIIFDPSHPRNGGDRAKGFIKYDQTLIPIYSTRGYQGYRVRVKFYVYMQIDARCPLQEDFMKVEGFASETIEFDKMSGNTKPIVKKVFRVCDVCCGPMNLVLRLNVDKNHLKLLSMELKKISMNEINADPT